MHEQGHRQPQRKKLHQFWQSWVVIGLMPVAMGNYVLTLDDSMEPDGPRGRMIPAQSITASS